MRSLAPLLGLAAASCGVQSYACQSSEQCNEGTCQPSGYCSFPDPECESGQRYGEFAIADLRGRCVQADAATSSTSEDPTTTPPVLGSSSSPDGTTSAVSSSGEDASTAALREGTSTSSTSGGEATGSTGPLVDSDLIAWWTLDGDPADGAQDATPNGLDGTCDVCPTSVPAVLAHGFGFTGAEVITVDDPAPFVSDTFTISAWIRVAVVDEPTSFHHVVTKPVGPGVRNSWEIIIANLATPHIRFVVSNPTQASAASVELPGLDTWIHVTGTYDGADARLYIDGEPQSVLPGPSEGVTWDDHPVLIGGDIDNEVLRTTFIGDIDDVRVYGRALDSDEVAALAAPP